MAETKKISRANVIWDPLTDDNLSQPQRWRKPRTVSVGTVVDLFAPDVTNSHIIDVLSAMAVASRHTFQVVTSYPQRVQDVMDDPAFQSRSKSWIGGSDTWLLPNVWLGVLVQNQRDADKRIPALLDAPVGIRFVSCEPLLGSVKIGSLTDPERGCNCSVPIMDGAGQHSSSCACLNNGGLHWVVVGGAAGKEAKPMHPDWARSLRDECEADSMISFMFTGRGDWTWDEPRHAFYPPRPPFTDRKGVMHPRGSVAMTKSNPFDPFRVGHPDWGTVVTRVGKAYAGHVLDGRTWEERPDLV